MSNQRTSNSSFPVFHEQKRRAAALRAPRYQGSRRPGCFFLGGCLVSFHPALCFNPAYYFARPFRRHIPRGSRVDFDEERKGDAVPSKGIKVFSSEALLFRSPLLGTRVSIHRSHRVFESLSNILLLVDTSARNLLLSNELRAY